MSLLRGTPNTNIYRIKRNTLQILLKRTKTDKTIYVQTLLQDPSEMEETMTADPFKISWTVITTITITDFDLALR